MYLEGSCCSGSRTKIASWSHNPNLKTVGVDMMNNCIALPALGASGGVLIAALERLFSLQHLQTTSNTISANITMLVEKYNLVSNRCVWPSSKADKIIFMQEIANLKQNMLPACLILGDFNLIYHAWDKNNSRINLTMLNSFKSSIDNLQLAPIELQTKNIPGAMIRQVVDHLFAMPEWIALFPRSDLQAVACLGSDLLTPN